MSYELDPFPYEYGALEPRISEQMLAWHHDTHHQGHVDGWNAAEKIPAENRETGELGSPAGVFRNITHNGSGHILHDLFWQNMSSEGDDKPEGALVGRIAEDLDSYEVWKGEFEVAADAAGGWALLMYDSLLNQLRNVVVNRHDRDAF